MSVNEIARITGVSHSTLYRHLMPNGQRRRIGAPLAGS
ncbi:MAG: helix-turn-helix domain-containing protein [Caldilineaceae bacterium]|nr:helix-turn-helix domain-containing protein [Caldilineaceae bacterium]